MVSASASNPAVPAYGDLSVTATCPVGTVLTGGGGTWSSTSHNGSVSATESYPSAPRTWTYTAQVQNTGSSVQVSATAYAVCAS